MYLDDEFVLSDLKDALKFTHYLNVKNLIIVEYSWEFLEKIVPMLKPGYLTTIDINSSTLYDLGGSMKKVFETEQWKRAKCFFMDGTFFMWPLHHLYHFEKFTVSLEKLSVENIRQMKETLFTSPNFEKCSIWVDDDIKANAIGKEFGVGTWEDENNPEFMKIYRYPMPDFFKSNPMALRHCLLYEYLRDNPVEQSFIALRMTVGPGVFKKEELQVWFNQFNQGIFDMEDGKEPIEDMIEVLRSDKYALRVCILYESLRFKTAERTYSNSHRWLNNLSIHKLRNNPSFSMYNSFCKVVGKDVMKYREFDFWFYRFLDGEFDLNYERDMDKKNYELMDMPIHVMENITEYLDIFDRAKLVQTSRSLRTFVEDQKIFVHTLKLDVSNHTTNVSFGKSVKLQYVKEYAACRKTFKNREEIFRGVAYWKQAIRDFKSILKNPKLHLDTLEIELKVNKGALFNDLQKALPHHLNVENLKLKEYSWGLLSKLLLIMKPGYLSKIDIHIYNPKVDSMNTLFEIEQWKQAKYFEMDRACFIWPLHHLFHFKEFHVWLLELSLEDIRQMKEILFKSPDFEKCSFFVSGGINMSIVAQEFGSALLEDPPCAKYLRDDKYALRVCILYESLKYKSGKLSVPIFEVFANFCKLIGDEDVLKYPEFEFWYYRFLNEEFDLNYERDKDKKSYELMDMPIDIMTNVVEYLDIFDRFQLAKTSPSLQTFVEDQKLFHHILKLRIDDDVATISFDESDNIRYTWKDVDCQESLHHWEQALLVLKSILKNPKLHLNILEIDMDVDNQKVFNGFLFLCQTSSQTNQSLSVTAFSTNFSKENDLMTDFFIKRPTTLKHCLLYEYLHKGREERNFDTFCMVFGDDDARKKVFHLWFNQFKQGMFGFNDDNTPNTKFTDMRDVLRRRKYVLRFCILYEVIKYANVENGYSLSDLWPNSNLSDHKLRCNPSFVIYNNFCNVVGEDAMEYREFDFWFYRFLNGEIDLNYQINKDKKVHELSDMPIDVMENIVEYLDIVDRMKLAKTSRSLQTFVEHQKLFHRYLDLELHSSRAIVSLGDQVKIEYIKSNTGCCKYFNDRKTSVEGACFWKKTLLDLKSILKNPNLHLNRLVIDLRLEDDPEFSLDDFENTLMSLPNRLNVRRFFFQTDSQDALLKFLPYLKPGYLTEIDIHSENPDLEWTTTVFETEQWKKTQYFRMFNIHIYPLRQLYHFKDFDVSTVELSVEDVREMKEILFKSPNFESCLIWVLNDSGAKAIKEEFDYLPIRIQMADFFKNNPMALRHCILYEYLRKSRVERVLDAFSIVFGDDVINKEELHSWFNQFEEGIFDINDGKEPIADMREVLCSDKYALHTCVLYESLKYKLADRESAINSLWPYSRLTINEIKSNPSFAMYKMFCKVVGNAVMEYQEFDFWFYRFLNGEYDLNYERDKDEKIYQLVDMPIDVMENVAKYLDIFDRVKLARTSRSLQTFVEDQKLFHHTLKLNVTSSTADVTFGGRVNVSYFRNHTDYVKFFKMREELFQGLPNWKRRAILDLKSILKNPKLHLNNLEVVMFASDKNVCNDLEDALKFTHLLNVKNLILKERSWGLLAKIVPMLKPGYLATVYMVSYDPKQDSMNTVFETEQWKQAKNFRMEGCFMWPLHHLYHFKEFTVELKELAVEDIRQMKETLFKSPTFEKCSLTLLRQSNMSIFKQEFGDALQEHPMTDFLRSNAIALRHCLLYEYLRESTVDRVFDAFCLVFGEDVMKNEEFQLWFDRFKQGIFDMENDKKPIADMRDILRDDKFALRACILYESLKYKLNARGSQIRRLWPNCKLTTYKIQCNPSFSMYNNFCEVIGDGVMEYREFDILFYRFLNGELDFNYQIDDDKEILELKDMPIDIMRNIVESLNTFERMKLAKTSRSLQTFVEDQKLFHQTLGLVVSFSNAYVSLGNNRGISYTKEQNGCMKSFKQNVTHVKGVSFWKEAIQDSKKFLANPKLHLDTLSICLNLKGKNVRNDLEAALMSISHHLNVRKLIFQAESIESLLKVLPSLKPGYLTHISLRVGIANDNMLKEIEKSEQWKQATHFNGYYPYACSLRHLFHFKQFDIHWQPLTIEDVRQMKEILFKSPDFERFSPNSYFRMTDFFKSNPMALRHCLLYEFLQGKRFLKSFYDFRDTVGNDIITRRELDIWFRRFANGRFYKKDNNNRRPISNMAEILRSDPKALRTCILYEFLSTNKKEHTIEEMFMRLYLNQSSGFLIFTKYKNFCKVIGENVMEYPEFEYWFYRFSNGEFDLDIEMEKNQKTLLDIPILVMEKIVENLDIFDRLLLSKTCHSLRIFSRSQKLFHHTLSLHIYEDRSRISFGCLVGDSIQYTGTTRKFKNKEDKFKGTHWEQAVQDFNEIVHSYPKLHLGVLQITSQRRLNGARFKGPTQLHVNSLILEASTQSIDIFPRILRVLKSGYLETITVYSDSLKKSVMRKVVEMDQWKQAKYLIMNEAPFPGTIRDLLHFKQFHVHCEELSVEDMREMKKILFNSLGFEKCTISLDNSIDFAEVREEFGDAIHRHTHQYQIPNSRDYFELKIFEFEIRVARKIHK
ncbi:unnamed protein product [Caenorhabditis brenneri]